MKWSLNYQNRGNGWLRVRYFKPHDKVSWRMIKLAEFNTDVLPLDSLEWIVAARKRNNDTSHNPDILIREYDTKYRMVNYTLCRGYDIASNKMKCITERNK